MCLTLIWVPPVISAGTEPDFPVGAYDRVDTTEPELPLGLDLEEEAASEGSMPVLSPHAPFNIGGFWELRAGMRTQNDPYQEDFSLGETRLQLETQRSLSRFLSKYLTDLASRVLRQEDLLSWPSQLEMISPTASIWMLPISSSAKNTICHQLF